MPVVKSDMSFSVKMAQAGLEWAGTNRHSVLAQRRNLFKPGFLGMLRDILRFNKGATRDLENPSLSEISLGDYLDEHGYGAGISL